jgi:nucleoside-diphosphate-sugar epimerase
MATVLLTGASTALGRRVVHRLQIDGMDTVAFDGDGLDDGTSTATLDGSAEAAVHLAPGDHDALAAQRVSALDGTPELLDHLTEAGVDHLVLLSSAMVYGAWPNNPVPLTEDAPLRPEVSFTFARQLAQVEQLVDEWRRARRGRTVAVLRPVLTLAADGTTSIVRALASGMGQRMGEDDAPAQFLHLDDLASAVGVAVERQLDGVYNVAPDGFVAAERVRALSGEGPRLRLPGRLADLVAGWRWRFQRGPIPPGLRTYASNPWLVANDRLKRAGWRPSVTNEQAYVEGTEARWWQMLTPKRKQELALGAMVVASLGLVAVVVSMIRKFRRSRSGR